MGSLHVVPLLKSFIPSISTVFPFGSYTQPCILIREVTCLLFLLVFNNQGGRGKTGIKRCS